MKRCKGSREAFSLTDCYRKSIPARTQKNRISKRRYCGHTFLSHICELFLKLDCIYVDVRVPRIASILLSGGLSELNI